MQPRAHHYAFSHNFLPRQAHTAADKMLAELRGPNREGFLFFLWQELGKSMGEQVSAVGLSVAGVDELEGDVYVLLTLPAPECAGESFFAAIVHRPGRTQFFVLDRSVEGNDGTLAKLGLDGSRLSYGPAPVVQAAFMQRVVELVRTEPNALSAPGALGFGRPGMPRQAWKQPVQRKTTSPLLILGGCMGALVIGMCVLTGSIAYESPDDFDDEPFTVHTTLDRDADGREQIALNMEGGPEYVTYRVTGPGVPEGCGLITSYFHSSGQCVIPLDDTSGRELCFVVTGEGSPRRFFGERIGATPRSEQTATVTRPVGLEWSAAQHATLCRGASCRLALTPEGAVELIGAEGALLSVNGSAPARVVPIDLAPIVDRLGVRRVLEPEVDAHEIIADATITLASGESFGGQVEVPLSSLSQALTEQLARTDTSPFGAGSGNASLALVDGRMTSIEGSPQRLADIGRVLVMTSRQISAGQCGPYSLYGIGGGDYYPRTRTESTVTIFDRVGQRVESRRVFRGDTARCPQFIDSAQTSVGVRDTADADEYLRSHLASQGSLVALGMR